MILLVDAQTIGILVTAVSVTIAAVYYVMNIRISQRNQELSLKSQELMLEAQRQTLETRQAQLMMGIYDKFSGGLWDKILEVDNWNINSIDDFMEIYKPENRNKARIFNELFAMWENIGVLLHEDLVDIRMIARWIGGFYRGEWERWGPYIRQMRVITKQPRGWIEAEYFYDRLMEFAKQNPEYGIIPQ